jgi:hypothetical protein
MFYMRCVCLVVSCPFFWCFRRIRWRNVHRNCPFGYAAMTGKVAIFKATCQSSQIQTMQYTCVLLPFLDITLTSYNATQVISSAY